MELNPKPELSKQLPSELPTGRVSMGDVDLIFYPSSVYVAGTEEAVERYTKQWVKGE